MNSDQDLEAYARARERDDLLKALRTLPVAERYSVRDGLTKGDQPGHDFHGNQYSDGGGAAKEAEAASAKANAASAAAKGKPPGAQEHIEAARAHKDAKAAQIKAGTAIIPSNRPVKIGASNPEHAHTHAAAKHEQQYDFHYNRTPGHF